jgi:hypothetical protein
MSGDCLRAAVFFTTVSRYYLSSEILYLVTLPKSSFSVKSFENSTKAFLQRSLIWLNKLESLSIISIPYDINEELHKRRSFSVLRKIAKNPAKST